MRPHNASDQGLYYCIKQAKWSKYPNHKSRLISLLNIDNSDIFDTNQTWAPKQKCDQVPAGSKHHVPMVAGLCHFVFSVLRGEKTPRLKTKKTLCEKTKRRKNAMRKEGIRPCEKTKTRNPPRERTKCQREKKKKKKKRHAKRRQLKL